MVLYYSSNGPSYIRSNAALMGVVQAPLTASTPATRRPTGTAFAPSS